MKAHPVVALTLLVSVLSVPPVSADDGFDRLVEETGIVAGPVAMRDWPGWRESGKILLRASDVLAGDLREEFPNVEFILASSQDDAVAKAHDVDAIVGFCSQGLLDAAGRATWIQLFSAGADRCVGLKAVQEGRVVLTNMQKMASPVLGEHAVAMVLTLARGLVPYAKAMESGQWRRDDAMTRRIETVSGKTLLVVGLGGIGTEVARRAAALGMHVTATRRSSHQGPAFVSYVGLADELPALAAEADFIVNTLPLTPETRGAFDTRIFAAAKPAAYYVSVGRGATTVTEDLVAAIESGKIAGAGLDVTDPEPLPPGHRLWHMDNVIITPHIAGAGGNRERLALLVRENVRRFVSGDALFNVVDPASGY